MKHTKHANRGDDATPAAEAATGPHASGAARSATGPHASGCLVTAAMAALMPETKCAGCLEQRRLRTNAFLEG